MANLLCFLSILFTSLGIYFLVRYYTKKEIISLFGGLGFLTILGISYYWIATGNLPYVFALWTIPFSLYFLERYLKENKKEHFVFYSIIFFVGIISHIVVGFLIGVLMVIRLLFEGLNLKNFKKILLYGIIPVLLSSFWFIPFLAYSSSSGGYEGYVPKIIQLFGFNDQIAWGLHAGGIGVFAFLLAWSFLLFKKFSRDKIALFYLVSLLFLGFLLLGGLGKHYPLGVDAVRFVLPFSIISLIFIVLVIYKAEIYKNKFLVFGLFIILFIGIIWNMTIINNNLERFSYYKDDSRYGIFQNIIGDEKFPIKNEFTNYRFGTSKFIFGENLNYFMPNVPQTFGYQDAGMLNAPRYYDMRWHIWLSDDINGAIYWLDWFGIKYFEAENKDFIDKFKNDSRFKIVMNGSNGYDFTLFEYLDAKQIISLVDFANDTSSKKEKDFIWERKKPDKIIIKYNSIDKNDVILFKEFYHKSWKAKEIESGEDIQININKIGFMYIQPSENSKGVIIYQSKTKEEMTGLIFTILGIFLLIRIKNKVICS